MPPPSRHISFGALLGALLLLAAPARAATWYVWTNSAANGPGTAWTNAFHTIQGAVDVATNGDTVLVTNGVYNSGGMVTPGYSLTNRVCITNAITVQSVNGPSNTAIVAGGSQGPDAVRGVFLVANAALCGFTITNGHTCTSGNFHYDECGGGVMFSGGGTLSNCVVAGCVSLYDGGGVYAYNGGRVYGCGIVGNSNQSGYGGGVYFSAGGVLNNSTVKGNSSYYDGGGVNCYGASVTMANCLVCGNTSRTGYGGGINCSDYNSVFYNCTVVSNSAPTANGGGVHYNGGGNLANCIVVGNTPDDQSGGSSSISYTCGPGLAGSGNITNNPQFVNAAAGNYRLQTSSPCFNAGNNSYAIGNVDLDGNPRIMGDSVDMGAYEIAALGVAITNPAATVAHSTSNFTIGGISTMAVGQMGWTNAANGASGAFAATSSWQAANIPLASGTNLLTVFATNGTGSKATDSVAITRPTTVLYVWTNSPSPSAPFTNWSTAAHTIQEAVNSAIAGDVVLVTNGVYAAGGLGNGSPAISNRVAITIAITVQSINGPSSTVIVGAPDPVTGGLGTNATRCAYLSAGALSGFTLTNGFTRADNDWNTHQGGGGALLRGGVISNCVVTGCSASHFGGGLDLFGGNAWNCAVIGNRSYDGGGMKLQGDNAYNCLLRGNSASNNGGGAFFWQNGTLDNCTVAGNAATSNGGGVYCYQGGTNLNTIIYSNTVGGAANNWTTNSGGAFAYCCLAPNPGGSGNNTNSPMFVSAASADYRLRAGSPCINAGLNSYAAGATDLAGNPRTNNGTVDIGAYEYGYENPSVTITNTPATVPIEQDAIVLGGTNNAYVTGTMFYTNAANGASGTLAAQPSWNTPAISLNVGANLITLAGSNYVGAVTNASITITRSNPSVVYVAPGGSGTSPFTNWATAAHTIQEAVDVVAAGGAVWVSNGTYSAGGKVFASGPNRQTNRVYITSAITVQSVNGPSNTFIVGAGPAGAAAVRCVYMSAGLLSGFTLTNGYTHLTASDWVSDSGGGALLNGGGTISNCIMTGCYASDSGGGAFCYNGGTLNNCIISDSSSHAHDDGIGGGVFCYSGGTLNGCVINANSASSSAGSGGMGGGVACMYGGTLNNCTITNNSASANGGGGVFCTSGGTLNNCRIANNLSQGIGGGASLEFSGPVLRNCLINDNTSWDSGGGAYVYSGGQVINCTIADNQNVQAEGLGSGGFVLDGGTVENCIVAANRPSGTTNLSWSGSAPTVRFTFSRGWTGSGNIDASDPKFASGFRLQTNSPCIDAGTNESWMAGATDLDGNPRIANGTVDMGAFEYQPPTGYARWATAITNGQTAWNEYGTDDGYVNLLKYATGSSATQSDTLARMNATSSNGLLTLRFNRNTNATDVTLTVEGANSATNDATWTGIATNIGGAGWNSADVTELGSGSPVSVTARDNVANATNRFMRLRVSMP